MSALTVTDNIFFTQNGLNADDVTHLVTEGLKDADGGELFLEYTEGESLRREQQRTTGGGVPGTSGFGLRYIANGSFGYATNNELTLDSLQTAINNASAIKANGSAGKINLSPVAAPATPLFSGKSPLGVYTQQQKADLLKEIDDYVRAKDPRVKQVTVDLRAAFQAVQIIRADGQRIADLRPMARMAITTVMEENGDIGKGYDGLGGRHDYTKIFDAANWKAVADNSVRQAAVNLHAQPPPVGRMTVVLAPGSPGVMIHEAVGHGLEGDFNAMRISAFSAPPSDPNPLGRVGQQVAGSEVTVIDSGLWLDRRGSLNADDEGSPPHENTLIENGILKGYMHDIMSAQEMGAVPTGNGRRESYQKPPMPRMTSTYIANGPHTPEKVIRSVDQGIYAVDFSGGVVQIENGDFVFEMSEAYLIEHGEIQWDKPLKGATMTGNGPESMKKVVMVANDLALDHGTGACGKNGQTVPVGLGTPTLRMDDVLVGGQQKQNSPQP